MIDPKEIQKFIKEKFIPSGIFKHGLGIVLENQSSKYFVGGILPPKPALHCLWTQKSNAQEIVWKQAWHVLNECLNHETLTKCGIVLMNSTSWQISVCQGTARTQLF